LKYLSSVLISIKLNNAIIIADIQRKKNNFVRPRGERSFVRINYAKLCDFVDANNFEDLCYIKINIIAISNYYYYE